MFGENSRASFSDFRWKRYGMTENAATCTKCWPNDPTSSGTVGPPQPINEVKLVDVPSMGYTAEDKPNPRGELCIRGVNCFFAYHKGILQDALDLNNF